MTCRFFFNEGISIALDKTKASAALTLHYVHGLVNTGNSCFLNSVLQALSALSVLPPYLESILNRSDELQLPEDDIQVTEALLDTMEALQQPLASHKSFRPRAIVSALEESRARDPNASGYRSSIMNREQQDAQELFQMISSALSSEEATIQKLQATRPLLGLDFIKKLLVLAQKPNEHQIKKLDSNPMIGMLASRLSCMQCGYTEAIRHFTFDNLSLSLPSNHSCTIEDCLKQYINLESLHDVVCRKCSLQATLARICSDLKQLDNHQPLRHSIAQRMALKSKLAQQRKVLESAIRSDVERPLQDIKLSKVVSRHCTKQVMMAKSPRVLCLHFIRSQYSNYGTVSKNSCQVNFPEYLDISPFCTTGVLLTQPNFPMSISEQDLERLGLPGTLYRLQSIVVHYGGHSYGHFIAYRRKPESITEDWFRVSDETVESVTLDHVLRSNPYMCLYERVETADEKLSKN
ncbi:cysteine proteinase, partial [Dissophora ornata]